MNDAAARASRLTRGQRLRAWLHMLFADHAVFRYWFNTRRQVAPGFYRSSHPLPHQLRAGARAGVRAVLSLRGDEAHIGSNRLERELCAELGLQLVHFPIGSRDAPSREQVLRLAQLFRELPRPLWVHCKSGADRAGLASAIYLMLEEKQPLERALRELRFWPYGHVRQAKTGILDHFFECYRVARDARGVDFLSWIERDYDREAVRASFHESWWARQIVDRVLKRE